MPIKRPLNDPWLNAAASNMSVDGRADVRRGDPTETEPEVPA